VDRNVPSGMSSAWKLWRHCICRNGFYPIIVAPFVTAAFFLDIYSSTGCSFIHVNVGIDPINVAWNETELDLGLFHYSNSGGQGHGNFLMDTFHPECQAYDSLFNEYFITGDKTWKMSQILAFVSGGAGCLATLVIWMMVITPISSCFLWPGILLPAVLLQLLSGSARFIFFDTQICHEQLWVPEGEDALPVKAYSCTLMKDSFISIVTSVLCLSNVLMICLRVPKRRKLDHNYGMMYKDVENDMLNLRTDTMEDSTCKSFGKDVESQQRKLWNSPAKVDSASAFDLEGIISQQMKVDDYSPEPAECNKRSKPRKQARKNNVTGKADVKTEKLRTVEPSIDYANDKEFQQVMNGENHKGASDGNSLRSRPKSTRSTRSASTRGNSQVVEQMNKQADADDKYPTNKSKAAPSDEGSLGFRSPLKAFKDIVSPKKSVPKSRSDAWTNIQTKSYDDDKIMKCVANLEHSFSQNL